MRSKQYLAALRPKDGVLVLSTMVYADEVNDPLDLGEIEDAAETSVSDKELKMAAQLIESLTEPFAADQFQDNYRNQVLDLVERKASGEEEVVAAPAPKSEEKVVDLMAALEASVKEAKASRTRHPTSKASSSSNGHEDEEETTSKRKSTAKSGGRRKSA